MARKLAVGVLFALASLIWFDAHAAGAAVARPPVPTEIKDDANHVVGTFPKDTQITVAHQANGATILRQGSGTTAMTITVPSPGNFHAGYGAACPALPPPIVTHANCPSGTTGAGWTQTATYTAVPAPQCNLLGQPLPADPPAGVCMPNTPPPPTNVETTFDHFYQSSFVLNSDNVSNWNYQRYPNPAKTSLSTAGYFDSVHGTYVWRLTNRLTDGYVGTGHVGHEYSTHGPTNSDNTMTLVEDSSGFWYIIDGTTNQKISQTGQSGSIAGFAGDCEAFWSPTDPHEIWRTDNSGSMKWYKYNTVTKTTSTLFDLTGRMPAGMSAAAHLWFKGEGRPSNDGRYFGLQVDTAAWAGLGAIMYDRVADQVIGWCSGCGRPDNVKTSPLGNYFLMMFYDADLGARACPKNFQGTDVHQCLKRTYAEIEHGDVGLDQDGKEILMQNDYSGGPEGGHIRVSYLDTGATYAINVGLLYPGTNHASTGTHISGIMSEKHHGWFAIDYEISCTDYNRTCPDPTQFNQYDRVGFIHTNVAGPILWLAEETSRGTPYFAEPQVTTNKDGTRIYWRSPFNYRDGAQTEASDTYMVGLPSWFLANWAMPGMVKSMTIAPTQPVQVMTRGAHPAMNKKPGRK